MRRWRIGAGNVVVAALIGCAAAIYAIRGLSPENWVHRPGMWDLLALVTTEPRFTGPILLTVALLRTVLLPDPILPVILRRGTYRKVLVHEATSAVCGMVLPTVGVLLSVFLVTVFGGLDFGSRSQAGTAAAAMTDGGLPIPLGVLAQLLLVVASLTTVHVALAAVRMAIDNVIPVIVGAFLCWCWMGVSVVQLQTVVDPDAGTSSFGAVASSVGSSTAAVSNSSAYLDLVITIGTHGVPAVLAAVFSTAALSYALVAHMDRCVRRGRQPAPLLIAPSRP